MFILRKKVIFAVRNWFFARARVRTNSDIAKKEVCVRNARSISIYQGGAWRRN